jgi:hypothetical protein
MKIKIIKLKMADIDMTKVEYNIAHLSLAKRIASCGIALLEGLEEERGLSYFSYN